MFTNFSFCPLAILNISINDFLDAIICHSFLQNHFAIVLKFFGVTNHASFWAMRCSQCGLYNITNLCQFIKFSLL